MAAVLYVSVRRTQLRQNKLAADVTPLPHGMSVNAFRYVNLVGRLRKFDALADKRSRIALLIQSNMEQCQLTHVLQLNHGHAGM